MDTLELRAYPTSPWISVQDGGANESSNDDYHEFLATDGKKLILAVSDGGRLLNEEGGEFPATFLMPIPEAGWIEGMPQIGARVLAEIDGVRVIATRDEKGWLVDGEWVELDVDRWQSLPDLRRTLESR
jgi:hypothetical protein